MAATTPVEVKPLSRTVSFATAGMGGVLGWICVHPFNTLASRMNLNAMNSSIPTPGFVPFTRQLVASEGFMTLYSGISAGITRQIFYATSRFGLYEVFRDQLAQYRETDIWSRLLTGCLSGGAAAFVSCPAEVSLVRIANDRSLPEAKRRNYKGVFDAAINIAKKEGIPAFWRGCTPFVSRAMLVGATQVGTYDQFKEIYANAGVPRGIPSVFCASLTAGLIYSLITMPLEAVKNRMAFQQPTESGELIYKTTLQSMKRIIKTEGFLSLYSGYIAYYGRCGGHTVLMFIAVEQLPSHMVVNEREQAGMMVAGMGLFYTAVGISMMFDRSLLAGGNILFVFGITLAIGLRNALDFFFKSNLKGSICLLGGVLLVLVQWAFVGMIFECIGFFLLFHNLIPLLFEFITKIPFIGPVVKAVAFFSPLGN